MSAGTPAPAGRPATPATPGAGGFTFAENPACPAPQARLIWHAALDPGTLPVAACPADPDDLDSVRLAALAPWLTVAVGPAGTEHAVLSDGWHHIRLDIEEGRLADEAAVLLHYRLRGIGTAQARLLPLRRLLDLSRHGRFTRSLFPRDPRIARGIAMLRVHDALREGASQREIAAALFGHAQVDGGWNGRSDALRSRVRRLVREARAMAGGGYRQLMRKEH